MNTRGAAAALLLALSACGPRPPQDAQSLASGYDTHAFHWTQPSRLFYIRGRYPDKSYLSTVSLVTRKKARHRFPGHSLYQAFDLEGQDQAIAATTFLGEGMHSRSSMPQERRLLLLGTRTWAVLREAALPDGSTVLFAGRPVWARKPLVVFQDGAGLLRLTEFDAQDGLSQVPLHLEGALPVWGRLAPDAPQLVLLTAGKAQELLLYDLELGRVTRRHSVERTFSVLGWAAPRLLFVTQRSLEGKRAALFTLDTDTGSRRLLLEAEGFFEQALATPEGVFAISSLPQEKPLMPGEKDFRRRTLHLIDQHNGGELWSLPWTKRKGEFLGFDEAAQRILFAVTDGDAPGAWSLKPGRKSLAAAVPLLDKGPSVLATALLRLSTILAGAAAMAALIMGMRSFRR